MRNALFLVLVSSVAAAAAPPPPPAPPLTTPPMVRSENTIVWPGAGTFGLRIGWGGGTATAGIDVGNVGVKYLINDHLGLSVDLGLGLTASRLGSGASFALDGGVMFYLRSPAVALRPYFPLMLGLGIVGGNPAPSTTGIERPGYSTFQLAFAGGIGAEYWFSKHFSVAGELLLRLQMSNFDPVIVNLGTLAPGIHASFYF
jgi:hypothetical protein